MVITGTRTARPRGESPVPVEVVDREAVEASGAEDLAELLEDIPGVDLQRTYLGAQLRLQGLEPEHVLITVDGVRQIGRKDGVLDLSRYPVEEIERIEIVKGPAAALYGSDAMGGVINIVTRRPSDEPTGSGRVRYGSFNTVDATAGLSVRGWRLGGGWHHTDGFDLDPSELSTDGPARTGFEGSGQKRFDIGNNVELRSQARYTRRNPQRVSASATGAVFDVQNVTEDVQLSLAPVITPDEVSKLTLGSDLLLFRDQYLSDQRDADDLDVYEDSRQRLVQLSGQYDRLMGAHLVSVGVDGFLEGYSSPRISTDGSRQRLAVFGQEDWMVTERLELLPGLRFDVDSQFGRQLSPKLSLRWVLGEQVTARAGYGRGFRAPSFRELLLQFDNLGSGYQVVGNLDLRPERSHGFTADVEWSAVYAPLSANVSGFYNEITDLITTDLASEQVGLATYSYINVARAMTRGGEVGVRWAPGRARFLASYALTDTLDRENDRPLPGRALHRGTASVELPIERTDTTLSGRARLVGAQRYYTDTNGDGTLDEVSSSPYANLDVRFEQAVYRELSLLGGVNNVLDAHEPPLLALPPRQFYAGVSGKF